MLRVHVDDRHVRFLGAHWYSAVCDVDDVQNPVRVWLYQHPVETLASYMGSAFRRLLHITCSPPPGHRHLAHSLLHPMDPAWVSSGWAGLPKEACQRDRGSALSQVGLSWGGLHLGLSWDRALGPQGPHLMLPQVTLPMQASSMTPSLVSGGLLLWLPPQAAMGCLTPLLIHVRP